MIKIKVDNVDLEGAIRHAVTERVKADLANFDVKPQVEAALAAFPQERVELMVHDAITRFIAERLQPLVDLHITRTLQAMLTQELGDTWRQRGGMAKLINAELRRVALEQQPTKPPT